MPPFPGQSGLAGVVALTDRCWYTSLAFANAKGPETAVLTDAEDSRRRTSEHADSVPAARPLDPSITGTGAVRATPRPNAPRRRRERQA